MLKDARAKLATQSDWIKARRTHIRDALARLDKDFDAVAAKAQ